MTEIWFLGINGLDYLSTTEYNSLDGNCHPFLAFPILQYILLRVKGGPMVGDSCEIPFISIFNCLRFCCLFVWWGSLVVSEVSGGPSAILNQPGCWFSTRARGYKAAWHSAVGIPKSSLLMLHPKMRKGPCGAKNSTCAEHSLGRCPKHCTVS